MPVAASARLLASLALSLVLVFGWSGPAPAQQQPYQINVLLGLTGSFALIGASMQMSLRILERRINETGGIHGRPVRFVIQDNQTNPLTDVQLATPLISSAVPVIFDGGGVAGCKAIEPLIRANGPVLYCLSPAFNPAAGSYGFANASSQLQTQALINFVRSKGWRRIAIMTPLNADGQNADATFERLFALPENKTLAIVAHEHYTAADISVSAQIANIRTSKPDVFFAWGSGSIVGTVYRSMKDVGLDVPVAASNANQVYQQLDQWKDILPKDDYMYSLLFPAGGLLPAGPQRSAIEDMYRSYAAEGLKPDIGANNVWDQVMLVVTLLRQLPENVTAQQLRDAILKLHGYVGVTGTFDFRDGNQRGLSMNDMIVVRWDPTTRNFDPVSGRAGGPLTTLSK